MAENQAIKVYGHHNERPQIKASTLAESNYASGAKQRTNLYRLCMLGLVGARGHRLLAKKMGARYVLSADSPSLIL